MPRFLLVLFLLVALSACQPGSNEAERGSSPDTTAAQDATTTGTWTLPWYYLAGPVCLVGGTAAPQTVLIESLLDLSEDDPEEFRNVLLDTSPQVSLIDRIRSIINSTASTYSWDTTWAARTNGQLAVRVRRMPSSQHAVLQRETLLRPDTLVLPWPFPNDTLGTLAARAQALGITIPEAPTAGAHGFYINRLLAVADTIVTKEQNALPDPTNEGQVKDTIVARVRRHPAYTENATSFPLGITVDTSRPTDATELRYVTNTVPGGQIILVLGWMGVKEIDFADWPCDAIE